MILKTVSSKTCALIIGGLAMAVGLSALANSFFRNRTIDRIVPGYGLKTPPLQEWKLSFSLPKVVRPRGIDKGLRQVTAYNVGDRSQTDSTPCTAASGENICMAVDNGEKRCAANFVKLGSLIHIQGYGPCRVTDRMSKRYNNRVDIALQKEEKSKAKQFGVQQLTVTELASPIKTFKSSASPSQPKSARKQKNSHRKTITQLRTRKPQKSGSKRIIIAQTDKKG